MTSVAGEGRDAPQVLLVDDDPDVLLLAGMELRDAGFVVIEDRDGADAAATVRTAGPDAVVLDLGLPGRNGLDVLRSIRADSSVPVIILTAKDGEADRVVGLELGADDYVVKPFSPRELVARVRSLLRRSAITRTELKQRDTLVVGDLVIDLGSRVVSVGLSTIQLTAREFDLLAFLAEHPRQVFTREQVLEQVWNSSPQWQSSATVNEHIYRIRQRLRSVGASWRIATVRGVGYRLEPEEPPKGTPG